MKPQALLIGLAPWVLFSLIAEHLGPSAVGYAAVAACLGSLFLALRDARTTGVNVIDAAGVVTFAILAAIGLTGTEHVQQLLVDFGRGGCALVLATVMLVSAATVPFTEQFARAQVDKRYWGSPVFRAVNRRISLLWAGLIYVMAIGHLVSGALAYQGQDPRTFLFNWLLPVGLVMYGLKQTERIAQSSGSTAVQGGVA